MKPPNIREIRRSELRRLARESDKLWQARYDLGLMKLEKPIRRGWIKHLKLRDDIARRKDAHLYQAIIRNCGVEVWGNSKVHADKNWELNHRSNRDVQFPGLRLLIGEKIKCIPTKARMMFDGHDWQWIRHKGYVKRYFCRVPTYYFETTYSKSYVTHLRVVDPDIESRMAEIDNILDSNIYYALAVQANQYRWDDVPFRYHKRKRKRINDLLKNYDEQQFDVMAYRVMRR